MAYNLGGKIAIVTGSSAGLGEAIALKLAKLGASVTLCGRNKERLEASKKKCTEASGGHAARFLSVQGDIGETAARNKIVDETVKKFGRLDIVVANHGGGDALHGTFETMTEEAFDNSFSVNVKSTLFLLQRAAPHLIKTKGSIVTISSLGSKVVVPGTLHYIMAKAALDHMASTLSVVLGPKGVRVNNIRPGSFPTLLMRDTNVDTKAMADAITPCVPLKRIGQTEELAEAVSFLVSDNARYITGAELSVDGGLQHVSPMAMGALTSQ